MGCRRAIAASAYAKGLWAKFRRLNQEARRIAIPKLAGSKYLGTKIGVIVRETTNKMSGTRSRLKARMSAGQGGRSDRLSATASEKIKTPIHPIPSRNAMRKPIRWPTKGPMKEWNDNWAARSENLGLTFHPWGLATAADARIAGSQRRSASHPAA